jgi:hypothetical protein
LNQKEKVLGILDALPYYTPSARKLRLFFFRDQFSQLHNFIASEFHVIIMFSQTSRSRDDMYSAFKEKFIIGKQSQSKEELAQTVKTFGKKYNVVFSIKSSSLKQGKFAYICKHGGFKRELENKSDGIEIPEGINETELINTASIEKQETSKKSGKKKHAEI